MSYRQLPTASRRIGFEIETPSEVEVHAGSEPCVRCSEERDGRTIGELEVSVFHAALVIDRDGILEEKVASAIEDAREPGARVLPAMPVRLPGASGYRGDLEQVATVASRIERPPLPYVYVFALAPHDLALDGGLVVTVRCALPEWPAADSILRSLKILSRGGKPAANDSDDERSTLPLIGSRED